MRPVKLTLTAFGPYKDKEVIDFEKLEGNQLFVISGQTGSGKTTIFDGISFALFGSASGEDREDTSLLRSHFADDNLHTAVELIFELNSHTYRLLRQLGHKKKGNKTPTGDKYEFYEIIDGKDVPMVDRQNVTNINREVEQLIGLTQDQFKQIVMLPQGEFRKLLTSETENKEEILRRLFQTDSYQKISEQLKERRNHLQNKFNKIEQLRDHYINMIYGTLEERPESQLFHVLNAEHYNVNQVVEGLEKEVYFYKKQVEKNEQAVKKANKMYDKRHSHYFSAKQINDLFAELNEKEKQLKLLKKQTEQITEKELLLIKAEQANDVMPLENVFNERHENEERRKLAVAQAEQQAEQIKQVLKKAQLNYETEKKNEAKREQLRKDYDKLNQLLPTVKSLAQHRTNLAEQTKQIKERQSQLVNIEKRLIVKLEKSKQLNKTITQYEQATETYVEKADELSELRVRYDHLNKFSEAKRKHKQLSKNALIKQTEFKTSEKKYREIEHIWLKDQAVILASNLKENEPCPVCGGTDHPKIASHHGAGVSKEQLDQLKAKFDEKHKVYNEAKIVLKNSESDLQQHREQAKEYGVSEQDLPSVLIELLDRGKRCKQEVDDIKQKQKELSKLRKDEQNLVKKIEKLEETRNRANEKKQKIMNEYTEIRAIYKERLTSVPEELHKLEKLNETIKQTAEKQEKLEKAWKHAEESLQTAKLKETEVASQLTTAKNELGNAQNKRQESKRVFFEAVKKMQFESVKQYRTAKLEKEQQKQLQEDIGQYKSQLDQLIRDVSTLKKRLEKKEKVDLTKLKAEVDQLKEIYEIALNTLNTTKSKVKEATTIYENIKKEHENVKSHEKQLRIVIDLYDLIRGQNEKRISFERYLQIGYLEQIIDAANERLRELSNGQFLLIRSERQETYGRQSGLALDIYDAYTGQARDVKSLSGGEKFNTSLCLALGMSDVIQSFQGGISIETMFIDEGFGSLDEESLNKAIDTLVDLQQSGRMIGVISHVEQLKAIFPAVLEVNKLKEGYSKTKFVVK